MGAPLGLFDKQILAFGNVGRHYLGSGHIGAAKASAMRDELKRFHPQVDVSASLGDALADWETIASADLVIDATGEWNVQYALNARFHDSTSSPSAILHCWISGNGAAAQALLNQRGDEFCFRCLRPDMAKPPRYPALAPHVEANIAEATCGDGAFYPYSVAAPAIAAGLATELVVGWANGKPGPRLRTIAIDSKRSIQRKPTTPTRHEDCPACGSRQEDD